MVQLLIAVITWNAKETSLCNKGFILLKKVHHSTIWGSLPHNKFCYELSQWNCPQYIREENWSPNSSDLNLLDYAIWDIMKKILYKNLKWYEDVKGLLPAISYAWDRLTKKIINNSIDQWRMRLKKVVKEGGDHIVHLIWKYWLMILRTFS